MPGPPRSGYATPMALWHSSLVLAIRSLVLLFVRCFLHASRNTGPVSRNMEPILSTLAFLPKPGTYAIRQDHQIRSCPRTACRNGIRRRLRLHEKGGKEHEMPVRRIKALQVSRRRVAPVLQPAHFPRKMPAHLRDVLIRKLARLIPQLTS